MDTATDASQPRPGSYADLLRSHTRGGFLWTRVVSQRIGAACGAAAIRAGIGPAAITLASLLVAVVASLGALALLPDRRVLAAVVALLGWQLAYGLDCADGQVARATGRTSEAGARLDLTVDYAVRVALAAVLVVAAEDVLPGAVATTAAVLLAFPLFDEATGRGGDAAAPSVDRTSVGFEVLGAVRDEGTLRAAAAVGVAFGPRWSGVALVALGLLGAAQLAGRVLVTYRRSAATRP